MFIKFLLNMSTIYLDNCTVFSYKKLLFFVGKTGVIKIKLPFNLTNISFLITKSYIKITTIKQNEIYQKLINGISNRISQTILESYTGFSNKIMLFGIGFRSWTCKTNNGLRCLILKIGFSRDVCIKIPPIIKVTILKPTLILFKSLDKNILNQFIAYLRSLKAPDSYKGKGLRYTEEKIVLKAGKA